MQEIPEVQVQVVERKQEQLLETIKEMPQARVLHCTVEEIAGFSLIQEQIAEVVVNIHAVHEQVNVHETLVAQTDVGLDVDVEIPWVHEQVDVQEVWCSVVN